MANIKGTAANNNLVGTVNNDVIDGLGGADTMAGGLGNDVYIVDNIGDIVIEKAGEGIDTVQASISYMLTANVENLQLTGTANLNGTGNILNNSLTGNSGNNILDGGAGVDTMAGGAGNDTYFVDNVGDVVTEANNQGTDNVQASVNYTIAANIENLALIGAALIGTGNTLNNTITGNSANNTLSGGAGVDTLIGGLGDDTYIVDNAGDVVTELAGAGIDNVQASASYVLGANVENLTLTGIANINGTGNALDNIITGNNGNNTLNGGAGNDTLNGGAGIDSLIGGTGNDTYIVDNAGDIITELVGEGTDTAQASVSYTLGATNIENLVLTGTGNINGTGNTLDNVITGNSGNNVLNGGAGNDTLNGGLGLDNMIGGTGNDTFIVDNAGDVVTEAAGAGTDTAQASVSYVIGANVENLILTGTANINGTGNTTNNTITGNSGNNILDGGAGADTLIGGLGDDTYIVDNAGDVITEAAGEGIDTVQTSSSYTLGANIENLVLTGTANINGTGNALNNVITGNSGNNTLDGAAGIDTLIGGAGNDTYIVVDTDDVIIEAVGGGIDTVQASIDYTLGNTEIENLTLIGSASIGTGNALNNTITGNALDNVLDGADGNDTLNGAGGSDILIGGFGDDTYIINDTSALVIEGRPEGYDTVISTVDYALGAYVENLTLAGTAAINGTGNELNNTVTGNAADNIINGGAGYDYMIGGAGNDTYVVDSFNDWAIENVGEGVDTVESSDSYELDANIENLSLTGELAINGTGNAVNNIINGNSSSNVIDGSTGADTMIGGAGGDTYIVDDVNDVVVEELIAAEVSIVDTVESSVDYTLGANVENLELTGAAINATGNELDNQITGNEQDNVINGAAGADTMIGGAGGDTYIVDDAGDIVIEAIYTPAAIVGNFIFDTKAFSPDGRYELITSNNAGLVVGDTNNQYDVFLKDYTNGTTIRVNTDVNGNQSLNGLQAVQQSVSDNGRFVLFLSNATDLVAGDTASTYPAYDSRSYDLFLKDTLTGAISQVNSEADTDNSGVGGADVSFDGHFVAYQQTIYINNPNGTLSTAARTLLKDMQTQKIAILSEAGLAVKFSTDGQLLLYGTTLKNLTTGAETQVDTDANGVKVENTGFGSRAISMTSDGHYIAFADIGRAGFYVKDTITGGLTFTHINPGYAFDDGGNVILSISEDGSQVTYLTGNYYTPNNALTVSVNPSGDTVESSVNYTLSDNVENLILLGDAISGIGNALHNTITGNGLNNLLDGGAGEDTMIGGFGDDTYVVHEHFDTVIEQGNAGIDTVESSAYNYILGANVENLTLVGNAYEGTGNSLDNFITGNAYNNVINGAAGNDTMAGGLGSDTYTVDSINDVIIENADEGIDRVDASLDYVLGANIESLILTGVGNINGTGNDLDNQVFGNSGDNILQGGLGLDTLYGGNGNDSIDGGLGNDTVNGGAGNDTLAGGDGNDIFQLNLGLADYATVLDFGNGADKISLDFFFQQFSSEILDTSLFVSGAGVVTGDGSHQVIYNTTTGDLYYEDGLNPDAPIQFASLVGVPTIDANDFLVHGAY